MFAPQANIQNILWYDLGTNEIKIATHARFDEGINDLPTLPPNAAYLKRAQHGATLPAEEAELSFLHLDVVDCPFAALHTEAVPITCEHPTFGLEIAECDLRLRVYVAHFVTGTSTSKIRNGRRRYTGAYLVSINDVGVFSAAEAEHQLSLARSDPNADTLKLVFAPESYVPRADRTETASLNLDQIRSITALRHGLGECHQPSSLPPLSRPIEDPLDDDMAPNRGSYPIPDDISDDDYAVLIRSLTSKVIGSADEQALGSFTRRKLRKLTNWPEWHAAEAKQLNAMDKQGMYGEPVPAPPDSFVLRQHWTYSIKTDGTRKARNCCDGSNRAAPGLRAAAQTYASCVEQPCMRLFFALSSALGLTVLKTDANNAYANSPAPQVPTFVRIDDAYAEWYYTKHGIHLDRSLVLPVLHALQGHPESGALWERHINGILAKHGFKSTTHERNIYQATIDGQRVLICRQVDDLAVASADASLAKSIIASVGKSVDLTGDSILESFNGVDVEQTRDYIKISCTSYIERLLKSHGWDTGPPNESPYRAHIEPLSPSITQQLDTDIGPLENTPESAVLATKMSFSYRSVLGELMYAYVVCRMDIGYAVTKLARYSTAPAEVHYSALKRLCRYLRQNKSWGLIYWRPHAVPSLPIGSEQRLETDLPADFPVFPQPIDPLILTGYIDAAHANDIATRRSVTGIVFTLCGAAIAYRSKLQPTVSTSSTEAEFIAAVSGAKTAKYLRTVLAELGFPQLGPTKLYEDNQATILMVNASRPTPRARHIDIQHFAIQEWKENGDIILEHIAGIINPSDSLTKPLGWILHQRHVRRAMGHHGPTKFNGF